MLVPSTIEANKHSFVKVPPTWPPWRHMQTKNLRGFCGDVTSHENQTMQIRVVFSSSEEVFMYSYLPCTWWSILPLPRMEICYIAVCPSFQIYYIKKEKRKTCLTQLIHRKIAQNITSFYFCLTAVPLLVSKHTKVCTDQFNTFTLNLTFFIHVLCRVWCWKGVLGLPITIHMW